jgi:hypothetical protein
MNVNTCPNCCADRDELRRKLQASVDRLSRHIRQAHQQLRAAGVPEEDKDGRPLRVDERIALFARRAEALTC